MEPSDPQQASRLQRPATRAHATTDIRPATAAEEYLAALGNAERHAAIAEAPAGFITLRTEKFSVGLPVCVPTSPRPTELLTINATGGAGCAVSAPNEWQNEALHARMTIRRQADLIAKQAQSIAELESDLRPSRIAEIMRLEMENASLRAAYSDLEARYAALFSLHIKQPTVIPDAAPEFPINALRHSA